MKNTVCFHLYVKNKKLNINKYKNNNYNKKTDLQRTNQWLSEGWGGARGPKQAKELRDINRYV